MLYRLLLQPACHLQSLSLSVCMHVCVCVCVCVCVRARIPKLSAVLL